MTYPTPPLSVEVYQERPHHERVRLVPVPGATGVSIAVGGACHLMGWGIRESSGTASARVDLYSGTGTTGLLIVTIDLVANESVRDWLGPHGLELQGLAVNLVSGAIAGSWWVVPL